MEKRIGMFAGWALVAGLTAAGLWLASGLGFETGRPRRMGYVVPGITPPQPAPGDSGDEAGAEKPAAFYLAQASAQQGAETFRKCAVCHSDQRDGPDLMGPRLWGVVGRPVASEPGFAYSDALRQHRGPWTADQLFQWLKDPSAYAPGTRMSFAGLSDPAERAGVIAYLNARSDRPQPLAPAR